MTSLKSLPDHGQAVWLDFLSRGFIAKGGLKKLVDEDGLRGVTSNPSIFEQAIDHGDEYDEAVAQILKTHDRPAGEIFEQIAVEDIQRATDVLRPVFDATKGADGFVSIEVSPYLAKDTTGTIAEAKRLWQAIDRNNLMIKVPATPEGMPAIHDLIAGGINVNITLLFAQQAYEQVVEAYLSGLEALAVKGGDVSRVASVASFFVSRIDTAVDKLLDEKIAEANDPDEKKRLAALKGKIAIANAKLAYQRYLRLFAGARWDALKAHGAKPQRLLWASTGTKNKAYSDVLYVEELIGPDTVNTMPLATIDAFRDHGTLRDSLVQDPAEAQRQLSVLGRAGIVLNSVTDKLLDDGVRLFADAADKLLAAVAKKRSDVLDKVIDKQELTLGDALKKKADAVTEDWRVHGNIRKLWRRDKSLWTGADEDRWLGWLDSPDDAQIASYTAFAEQTKHAGFADAVLLGMGGSVSAPKFWHRHSAGAAASRACMCSTPRCRRRSNRSRTKSISARRCSSCRANRAAPPSRTFSPIISSNASATRLARRRRDSISSPSPIPDHRLRNVRKSKTSVIYSTACRALAAAIRCCRRSASCQRLLLASILPK